MCNINCIRNYIRNKRIAMYAFYNSRGVLPYQSGGGVAPEPHGAHGEREREREEEREREREIKKCIVTKRELLNNLSNIYQCKVSPGGTFSFPLR